MNILIIEDEPSLQDAIRKYLEASHYHCEVAGNFDEADDKIRLYTYDCILVDLGLPGGSGLDVVRHLKEQGSTAGIIIISARSSLDDKLAGLDLGADDYLPKPFDLAELSARVNAVIRRRSFDGQSEVALGNIIVEPAERRVHIGDKEVKLTKMEFDLLVFLISTKGRVVTKETLVEHLWGDHMDLADSFDFIYVHINNLRKKIEKNGGKDHIKSVYGIGYRIVDD